jgi:hypothetical protein
MSLCCLARLESGLVGAMLQSWCGESLVVAVIEVGKRMQNHDS